MEDRRIFIRMNVKIPLKFAYAQAGIEGEAKTVDISANGVGFITNEKIPIKAPLEIWLQIPDNHQPLYVKGEVIWVKQEPDKEEQRIGLRLEKENFMGLARAFRV